MLLHKEKKVQSFFRMIKMHESYMDARELLVCKDVCHSFTSLGRGTEREGKDREQAISSSG